MTAGTSLSGPVLQPRGRGLFALALILIFLGLPLLLGWMGFRQFRRERVEARRELLERRLDDILASFDRFVSTDAVIERLLRRLETEVYASGRMSPRERLRRWLPGWRKALPGCFEFTVLDGDGTPIPGLCDGAIPRAVLRRLYLAAAADLQGDNRSWANDGPMIRSLLGPLTPNRGFVPSRLLPSNPTDRHRFLYLGRPRSTGMLIVRVTQLPEWSGLGIRLHWKRLQSMRGIRIRLIDRHRHQSPRNRAQWKKDVAASLSGGVWRGRTFTHWRVLTPRYQVTGRIRLPSTREADRKDGFIFRAGLFGWIGLSLVLWAGFISGRLPTPSVRAGMIAAFAYSAGIPLLALGGTARLWLQERHQVLEDETHHTVAHALQTLDSRYPPALRRSSIALSRVMAGITCPAGGSSRVLAEHLDRARRVLCWDLCRIYDQAGRVVLEDEVSSTITRMAGAFDMMSNGLARLLQMLHRSPETAAGPAASADESTDGMYSKLLGHLGSISALELSGVSFLSYLHPLYDQDRLPRFMAHMVWTHDRMQLEFVRKELQVFSRQLDSTDLLAWNPEHPSLSHPVRHRYAALLAQFLPRIRSSSRESRWRAEQPDGTLLLTGIRGTHLDCFALVAVTDDRSIRAELDLLAWRLGTAAVLMLFISVTIGTVVARVFLEPVTSLTKGVEALAARRFSTRVSISSRDELGRLSRTFNEMMESLADLEVARTVQDAFFPEGPLRAGSWEVFGRCCSASQIGGDYFDYFALDERRVAFIIGDVTGHGVSAALVMAMAKALTAETGAGFDLVEVLRTLNRVIEQVLQGRKSMSCQVGILDTVAGNVSICNGGHCFPYLVRNGEARHLQVPGMLIGVSRGWRASKIFTFPLLPGDCLIGYTDALYESQDKASGTAIGFPRVREALPELVRGRAQDTEQTLRDWHGSVTGSGPANDDLTILVIQGSA